MITNNCGCTTPVICQETTNCGCKVFLESECIEITTDLECSNILKGQTLSEVLVLLDEFICTKFDSVTNFFNLINVGDGSEIYKGVNMLGKKEIRTLVDSGLINLVQGTNDITISVDEDTLNTFIEANQKTYSAANIGIGASVYKDTTVVWDNMQLNLRKINTSNSGGGATILKTQVENINDISIIAKSIKSSNGTITITGSADEIDIIVPEPPTFGYLKSFYVNSVYIPTVDSPSDGSIIRPYVTYDEAKTAFIGTGTLVLPEFDGAVIILQTDSITVTNPTVNKLKLKFENNSTLAYTGTDVYMFDTEILYPLIPKGVVRNELLTGILITLLGEGVLDRTSGIGLIRGLGSNRNGLGIAGDNDSQIILNGNITLRERSIYPSDVWDGDITNTSGVPLENFYGTPHKYSLSLQPTTPLLYTEYESVLPFRVGVVTDGTITFRTLVNTAIKAKGIKFIGNNLNFLVLGNYIATASATKMAAFPNHYQPQPNRNMIELDDSTIYLTGKLIVGDIGGYATTGVTNFFKIINDGNLGGNIDIFSRYYIGTFINASDVSNTVPEFNLTNSFEGSKIQSPGTYFVDTPLTPYTLKMYNSNIEGFINKSTSPITLNIDTAGTLSSFLDTPIISNIASYVNDAAATSAGLVVNSLYFNTTNNALDLVS